MVPQLTNPGVYVEEVPGGVRTIMGVATGIAAFVGAARRGSVNKPVRVLSYADFEQRFGKLTAGVDLGCAVRQFFLNGGTEAFVVRIAKGASVAQVLRAIRTLDGVDLFNILVIPGLTTPRMLAGAVDYCRKRRAFLIVDSPIRAKTPAQMQQVIGSRALPQSNSAAVYYPWTEISDPLDNGQPRITPPSGTIAGLFARTDSARGVWKAPAGTEASLVGVLGLEYKLTDADIALLNPRGVNCLRSFPVFGPVAWGARTLESDDSLASDWKYVPVRRLALFLEESLDRGTRWAIFEPNDESLWAQMRLSVAAFMHGLFRQGAFLGNTPRDAYFVKCDQETTTAADVANGVVNIVVGFAPLKPAEFVVIKIQQRAGKAPP